jgi:DNA-binding GntR family transcriptional regulator
METIKPRKSLTEETYDRLLDAICSGELAPGHRINQDELAHQLNVSRQPVNSAITLLKANKLVEDTGRRGVVVTKLDRALFASIYEFRSAIEPFAAKLASERFNGSSLQEAEVVLAAGEKAMASEDIRALVESDMAFHQLIYSWSENDAIISSMQANWHHIRRAMVEVLQVPSQRANSWVDHGKILKAISSGDSARAAECMQHHMLRACDDLISEFRL